jgi:hypothetical protein
VKTPKPTLNTLEVEVKKSAIMKSSIRTGIYILCNLKYQGKQAKKLIRTENSRKTEKKN